MLGLALLVAPIPLCRLLPSVSEPVLARCGSKGLLVPPGSCQHPHGPCSELAAPAICTDRVGAVGLG